MSKRHPLDKTVVVVGIVCPTTPFRQDSGSSRYCMSKRHLSDKTVVVVGIVCLNDTFQTRQL